jgi:cytochrome c553
MEWRMQYRLERRLLVLGMIGSVLLQACEPGKQAVQITHAVTGGNPQFELAAGVLRDIGASGDNIKRGQEVAMGTSSCEAGRTCYSCYQCHGMVGQGSAVAALPRLAGQDPRYLNTALQRFASGERKNATMQEVATALTQRQMSDAAAFFSALYPAPISHLPPSAGDSDSAAVDLGRQIAEQGLPEQNVPPCTTCHGVAVRELGAAYPDIAGQYADYLRNQLEHFRSGERRGPDAEIMQVIARNLSKDQMQAVASYYSMQQSQSVSARDQREAASIGKLPLKKSAKR